MLDRSTFGGGRVHSHVAGCEALLGGWVREAVSGKLPLGDLVEAEVSVVGFDDPVAERPDAALVVEVEAVGVAVANGVEPEACLVFAVLGAGEIVVDHALVGARFGVSEVGFEFGVGRRKAGEREGDAADQGLAVSFGFWFQVLIVQFREDEIVDGVSCAELGDDRHGWRFECPMAAVFGALLDPEFHRANFGFGERVDVLDVRRHLWPSAGTGDADPDARMGEVAGFDREVAAAVHGRFGERVEADSGRVSAMAGPAMFAQDWSNVSIEIDFFRSLRGEKAETCSGKGHSARKPVRECTHVRLRL